MTIQLRAEDAGTRARPDVGEQVTVRLPENPTTGFRCVAEYDDTRLTLVDDGFEGPGEPAGAGGERVLVFETVRGGPSALTLAKRRAWESGDPVETFAVELDVQQ